MNGVVDCEKTNASYLSLLSTFPSSLSPICVLPSAPSLAAFEDVLDSLQQVVEDACSLALSHALELSAAAPASLLRCRLRCRSAFSLSVDLRGLWLCVCGTVTSAAFALSQGACNRVLEKLRGLHALALLEILAQLLLMSTWPNASELCRGLTLVEVLVTKLESLAVNLLRGASCLGLALLWACLVPVGPSVPLDLLACCSRLRPRARASVGAHDAFAAH